MTDLRPTLSAPASGAHGTPPGVRALTADELGHLDRARAHLRASGADLTDPQAVGALLHSTRTRWAAEPGAPVPQAMVMALGVGVGDLVVARVPGARWALRTAGSAPSPAVVSLSGEDAALPLADVATRWRTGCTPTWVAEYVAAAAAHLAALCRVTRCRHRASRPARRRTGRPTSRRRSPGRPTAPTARRSPGRTERTATLPARTGAASPTEAGARTPSLPTRGAAPAPGPDVVEPALASALPGRPAATQPGTRGVLRERGGRLPHPPRRRPCARSPERRSVPAGAHAARVGVPRRRPVVGTTRVPARRHAVAPGAVAVAARRTGSRPTSPTRRRGPRRTSPSACSTRRSSSRSRHGGAARPFAVVDGSPTQSHQPHSFDGEPARALQEARSWVRTTGARACGGRLVRTPAGEDGDAVFVEASDAGAPSLVVAHRYSAVSYDEGRTRPARPVGDPLVLGQGVPLL